MDVNSSTKQTEVGVIPQEWSWDYLREKASKVGSGITPTGGSKVYQSHGRPFIRSQNVGWGHLQLDDMAFIDDATHSTFAATEIESDDVFLNITGASIGRSAIADERVTGGNVNQHVCIIRTQKDELVPRFLNYVLLSSYGQRLIDSFQAGGNREGLNFGQIKSFAIPLPPLEEQRAIAEALSDVDALINTLDDLIAKKRYIKQGTMQQLLTGKKRLPSFDGEWEEKELQDGVSLLSGYHVLAQYCNTDGRGTPYITGPADFQNGVIRHTKNTDRPTTLCRENDILVTVKGSGSGSLVLANGVYCISRQLMAIRVDAWHTRFIFYALLADSSQIAAASTGLIPGLSRSDILETKVQVPDVTEQKEIASVLYDMETEIATLERKRDKTKLIKQGMMQELLTGKTRLV